VGHILGSVVCSKIYFLQHGILFPEKPMACHLKGSIELYAIYGTRVEPLAYLLWWPVL
jgi:hypothetical protein